MWKRYLATTVVACPDAWKMRVYAYLLTFVLLASAIFIEALHGPTIDNRIIPNLDKMVHVAAFGLLAFLLLRYLRSIGFSNGWRILLSPHIARRRTFDE